MKLPKDILFAIAIYYANRGLQYKTHTTYVDKQIIRTWTYNEKRKWDKWADLERISAACRKMKSSEGYTATAGTFWFTFKGKKASYCMTESCFPNLVKLKKGQILPD